MRTTAPLHGGNILCARRTHKYENVYRFRYLKESRTNAEKTTALPRTVKLSSDGTSAADGTHNTRRTTISD